MLPERLQARAARKHRTVQRQKLYTIPATPRAGDVVEVFYNPDVTVLRGRPDIWMRGSWNRFATFTVLITALRLSLPG
jgi:starch synthase